jgi:hypothetical protein
MESRRLAASSLLMLSELYCGLLGSTSMTSSQAQSSEESIGPGIRDGMLDGDGGAQTRFRLGKAAQWRQRQKYVKGGQRRRGRKGRDPKDAW